MSPVSRVLTNCALIGAFFASLLPVSEGSRKALSLRHPDEKGVDEKVHDFLENRGKGAAALKAGSAEGKPKRNEGRLRDLSISMEGTDYKEGWSDDDEKSTKSETENELSPSKVSFLVEEEDNTEIFGQVPDAKDAADRKRFGKSNFKGGSSSRLVTGGESKVQGWTANPIAAAGPTDDEREAIPPTDLLQKKTSSTSTNSGLSRADTVDLLRPEYRFNNKGGLNSKSGSEQSVKPPLGTKSNRKSVPETVGRSSRKYADPGEENGGDVSDVSDGDEY